MAFSKKNFLKSELIRKLERLMISTIKDKEYLSKKIIKK